MTSNRGKSVAVKRPRANRARLVAFAGAVALVLGPGCRARTRTAQSPAPSRAPAPTSSTQPAPDPAVIATDPPGHHVRNQGRQRGGFRGDVLLLAFGGAAMVGTGIGSLVLALDPVESDGAQIGLGIGLGVSAAMFGTGLVLLLLNDD